MAGLDYSEIWEKMVNGESVLPEYQGFCDHIDRICMKITGGVLSSLVIDRESDQVILFKAASLCDPKVRLKVEDFFLHGVAIDDSMEWLKCFRLDSEFAVQILKLINSVYKFVPSLLPEAFNKERSEAMLSKLLGNVSANEILKKFVMIGLMRYAVLGPLRRKKVKRDWDVVGQTESYPFSHGSFEVFLGEREDVVLTLEIVERAIGSFVVCCSSPKGVDARLSLVFCRDETYYKLVDFYIGETGRVEVPLDLAALPVPFDPRRMDDPDYRDCLLLAEEE